MTIDVAALSAEFPREAISWRAQSLTRNGDKAMALAYIDARDVMRRLDEVCGPENWQDRYEFHGARTVCYLSIRINSEWITKADAAGDTQVEAEKGGVSDALKRAAVKWGIGRYLYDTPTPWVPCDTYESRGKKKWSKWTADPWQYVKGHGASKGDSSRDTYDSLSQDISSCESLADLGNWWRDAEVQTLIKSLPGDWQEQITAEKDAMKSALEAKNNMQAA